MTAQHKSGLAEVLQNIRPVPPGKQNILRALLAVQSALGHVPVSAIPQIARMLGVSDAQVAGVSSYYSDLRIQSVGRHLVRVCMGESCLANHGGRVFRMIEGHLSVSVGENELERRFTMEQMSCAGN